MQRFGIELDDFQDSKHSPAVGNVIQDNVVHRAEIGSAIGPEAGGVVLDTVIRANVVVGSVQDGIQLTGPSTGLETSTLTGNVANRNGDWGIETVAAAATRASPSPSPVPGSSPAGWRWKKRSNTRSRSSTGMPGP